MSRRISWAVSFSDHSLVRFQRRDYAKIEIVETEKKGYGLRATADMSRCVAVRYRHFPTPDMGCRDTLIYEYVGDVVSNPTFIKRMREYAEEGIEHFYFMMLQKDEVS